MYKSGFDDACFAPYWLNMHVCKVGNSAEVENLCTWFCFLVQKLVAMPWLSVFESFSKLSVGPFVILSCLDLASAVLA